MQSTRTILIAADLQPDLYDVNEPIVTSDHATKLAHFREMMKSFTNMLDTVTELKLIYAPKYHDVTQEFNTGDGVTSGMTSPCMQRLSHSIGLDGGISIQNLNELVFAFRKWLPRGDAVRYHDNVPSGCKL